MDSLEVYELFYTDSEASEAYGGPITKEQILARLKADLGSWYLLGFGVWVIQQKSDNSFLGTCGYWQGKDWPVELTWWVLPIARGQGIATQASKAAIAYAYNDLKWDVVKTYMNDENVAARNLVEKLGGQKVDRQSFSDGLLRDIYKLPKPA
jgi:RimJ/RimL family protein N-acetyltransferase